MQNSSAEQYGLQANDRVYEYDGQRVFTSQELNDLVTRPAHWYWCVCSGMSSSLISIFRVGRLASAWHPAGNYPRVFCRW
jgi:hypothetical protein